MRDRFNGLALEDALRAAINVLRDSAESRRMPSGEALTSAAVDVHAGAADLLEDVLRDTGENSGKLTLP